MKEETMRERFALGDTELTVLADLDTTFLSFGADTSELHCWGCGRADVFAAGAFRTQVALPDARLMWDDADRYEIHIPSYMTETRTDYLVCKGCRDKVEPGSRRKPMRAR
jgi:hypothetical protein